MNFSNCQLKKNCKKTQSERCDASGSPGGYIPIVKPVAVIIAGLGALPLFRSNRVCALWLICHIYQTVCDTLWLRCFKGSPFLVIVGIRDRTVLWVTLCELQTCDKFILIRTHVLLSLYSISGSFFFPLWIYTLVLSTIICFWIRAFCWVLQLLKNYNIDNLYLLPIGRRLKTVAVTSPCFRKQEYSYQKYNSKAFSLK